MAVEHAHSRLGRLINDEQYAALSGSHIQASGFAGGYNTQDGQWGGELGRLDLRLRSDGGPYTLMSCTGELIPVTAAAGEDAATARAIAKYYKPISKYYDQALGEATGNFYDDRPKESTVLNLVCDAIRETAGADVALYNTGGVRSDIARGRITMWDLATVLPFRNNIFMIEIDGKRLKQALLEMKPGVSGVRYKVDNGDKLAEATINGKPIDDTAVFKVVTNDWFVGFAFKDVTNAKDTGLNCREAVGAYIKSKKTISPSADGRRVNNGSARAGIGIDMNLDTLLDKCIDSGDLTRDEILYLLKLEDRGRYRPSAEGRRCRSQGILRRRGADTGAGGVLQHLRSPLQLLRPSRAEYQASSATG